MPESLVTIKEKAIIQAGSKVSIDAATLVPYGVLTAQSKVVAVTTIMGFGHSDIDPKSMQMVLEIELVDNQDGALNGKVLCVGFAEVIRSAQ